MNKKGKRYKKGVRGQSQISFGVIFAIILIVFFVAFAIYGITKFLSVQKLAQISKFKSDIQIDISKMYQSTSGAQPEIYYIPKAIKQVCFVADRPNPKNLHTENMYFMPTEEYERYGGNLLENVNMISTISPSNTNPKKLCLDVIGGKLTLTLKKDYNQNAVTILK